VGNETILGELKATILGAKLAKTSGKILNKLFDTVIHTATRIRNSTQINKGAKSLGEMAVKIAEQNAGLDAKKRVLLMGTGETAAMVAKALNKKAYPFDVCSMTIERATGFSKILGGKPIGFKEALKEFNKFDFVFVATTSDYFALTFDNLRLAMENNTKGTMILDISDPRTVDDTVMTLPGIKLMFRDQLTEMEERDLRAQEETVIAVEKIIAKEIAVIEATMKLIEQGPQVTDVFASVDALRKKELEKALELLGETDEKKIKIITDLTTAIVDGILPKPTPAKK
jgi:glutamyl-tRNA reductase